MSTVRTLTRSFGGGEVTPEFFGRIDDVKYQTGAATMRNFIALPHGPAANRTGFAYVRAVKTIAKKTRVIPFTYSTTQTMVLEFGDAYIRFHTQGATLLAGSPSAYKADATVTLTIASPCVVSHAAHPYVAGDPVQLTTTGALPTGLTASTTCYVVNPTTNNYQLAATVGGAAINTTGTQSGVHTVKAVYAVGALVSNGGTNYYCTAATIGNAPPNVSYWYALPSAVYEIPSVYLEADLMDLHYVQSADVLTITHPNYAPRELRRLGATSWVLSTISFVSDLATPAAPTVVATVGSGSTTYKYKVAGVSVTGLDESLASASGTCTNNLFTTGNYNTISWATTSAALYNVYKESNGLYGYIGQTDALSFKDDNIAPDLGKVPPNISNPFSGAGLYPGAVSYFEQRRCFAGSTNEPQNLRMTRSGTESNMGYSIPTRDDDAINIRVAAREANTIRHIVPLQNLVLLTGSAEWRVTSVNSDAITPTSVSVKPQSFVGANNAQPIIVNNNIIYGAARGGHLREMAYNYQAGGYITGDLSLRCPHLFDGLDIVDLAYAKAPFPIVWAVSSNGKLLGVTYVPEQQIGAIHQHDTDGTFESCCVVAEGTEDALYVVVKRNINGSDTRYIERMAPRLFATQSDAFFVDCGATYSGAPVTTISGLTWLEGETVNVLGDGAVFPQKVVTGGAITLEQACSKVQVGLPMESDLETLPLAMQIDGAFGQGRTKNVNKAWLRVYRSSGIFVGPDENRLTEAKQRTTEAYGSPPALKSEEVQVTITPSWAQSGQVFIRQSDPLPLTIVSLTLEVVLGA